MTFVQAMTGQGGWPLNVFLAPDLKPFYGGTYWPPETRQGRPGFLQVLQQITRAWEEKRDQLTGSSEQLHQRLSELTHRPVTNAIILTNAALRHAGPQLKIGYDS